MNTQNPLPSAWRWSLRYSPIMRVIRGIDERIRRRRLGAQTIAASGLPAPLQKRIAAIVGRTRLHACEQRDIARELISHCFEAIESGKDEPEILASLGDPKTIAPLLRRASKRKRPLIYQLRRWAAQAALITFALSILFYALIAIRFYAGSPTIKTDYLAKANAPILAATESDRAWPDYEPAVIEWRQIEQRLIDMSRVDSEHADESLQTPAVLLLPTIPPNHPDRDATIAAIRDFRPALDRVIAATNKPVIGLLLSDNTREITIEGLDKPLLVTDPPSGDPSQQSMFKAIIPHLGYTRSLARVLAADIEIAREDGDADRVAAELIALIGLSQQIAAEPILISHLVSLAIYELAMNGIRETISQTPDLLSAEQIGELAHRVAARRESTLSLSLDGEQWFFEDFLQRTFTDDGNGDGRFTPEGARLVSGINQPTDDLGVSPETDEGSFSSAAKQAVDVLSVVAVASRRQQSQMYAENLADLRWSVQAGPASLAELHVRQQRRFRQLGDRRSARWYPVNALMPALASSVSKAFTTQANADATLTLLAADAYRLDHGAWPETLDLLVPRYLPAIPDDPFEPGASILYKTGPDGPTIWFRGADGDDDNARRVIAATDEYKARSFSLRYRPGATDIPDGDWVIFPPDLD